VLGSPPRLSTFSAELCLFFELSCPLSGRFSVEKTQRPDQWERDACTINRKNVVEKGSFFLAIMVDAETTKVLTDLIDRAVEALRAENTSSLKEIDLKEYHEIVRNFTIACPK
jgi:hypothetical protein